MIAGLCESPLTFQAIIIWRDELNDGKVLLRDIIDLDATYSGPDAKVLPTPEIGPDGQTIANIAVPGHVAEVHAHGVVSSLGGFFAPGFGRSRMLPDFD
jgi:hypothetical protein